jgi:hypothetical protein
VSARGRADPTIQLLIRMGTRAESIHSFVFTRREGKAGKACHPHRATAPSHEESFEAQPSHHPGLPRRLRPQYRHSTQYDKNRRGIGKSQPKRAVRTMERARSLTGSSGAVVPKPSAPSSSSPPPPPPLPPHPPPPRRRPLRLPLPAPLPSRWIPASSRALWRWKSSCACVIASVPPPPTRRSRHSSRSRPSASRVRFAAACCRLVSYVCLLPTLTPRSTNFFLPLHRQQAVPAQED